MRYRLQKDYDGVYDLMDNLLESSVYADVNGLFNWCVDVLIYIANVTNMTYEEANILIFIILQPSIIVFLFLIVIYQRYKLIRR
tara:strand:+ start:29 stop:280 length:252 start_codon:yes stop_codon:yes gene_type:complete